MRIRFNKKNKGAALVSVMIAITFVSIISVTLLMISLNNYQMKVINSNSKSNFYETEQDINVITAQVREKISTTTDSVKEVKKLVGGSDAATSCSVVELSKMVYPGYSLMTDTEDGSKYVKIDSDRFYISGGNIEVANKTGGKEITLKNISVKQVNAEGYENKVKTDIVFYVEESTGGGGGGGVGSCSFLLDNCISINGSSGCRLNVYGNSVLGAYSYDSSKTYTTDYLNGTEQTVNLTGVSVPLQVSCTRNDTTHDVTSVTTSTKGNAVIYLNDCAFLNYVGDNNVVFGDVYIESRAIFNIVRGSFTCYGNIYVADKGAFICNGTLNLGPDSGIYYVDSSGNTTKYTSKQKDKNIIFNSYKQLTKKDYDKMADHLKLFVNDGDDDGVLPNILEKAEGQNSGDEIYCYQTQNETKFSSPVYFHGDQFKATIPQSDLNNQYDNCLIFVSEQNTQTKITQTTDSSTIISKYPVKCSETHNISVTQLGEDVFNYYLNNENLFYIKYNAYVSGPYWSGYQTKEDNFDIRDFFNSNCNKYVETIFSIPNGSSTTPTEPAKTAINYINWTKE